MHKPGDSLKSPVLEPHQPTSGVLENNLATPSARGLRRISCSCECHPPELGGHICVEPEDESRGHPWDEGGGDEDVAAALQGSPQEHAAGVGVGRRGHPLLHRQLVQPVPPVVLHLQQDRG